MSASARSRVAPAPGMVFEVEVDGFCMDERPVTASDFRRLVRQGEAIDTSTGHIGFRCIAR